MRFDMCGLVAMMLAAGAAVPAAAQVHTVKAGTRLRVERRVGPRLDGRIVALTDDSVLLVLADSTRRAVAWTDVAGVRVDRGPASLGHRGMRGAVWGLLAGALAGAAVSGSACTSAEGSATNTDRGCQAWVWAAGAAGGFALGFVVGALFPGERWETLRGTHIKVGLAPRMFAVAVRMSLH